MITYGSVCSGIEAASVAWEGLGWQAAWFAEIEKFPAAVLAQRFPAVPNLGDMTKIASGVRAGSIPAPAIMVGGTPCQAFSNAGLGHSLDDPRGQLTLAYVKTADAIDDTRINAGDPAAVHVWENVPGSLYTHDNAFGHFLAGMAGEPEPFEPGPRPEPGKSSKFWRWKRTAGKHVAKWSKSGCVIGRRRKIAWRVLDAQYFGVPQRRRRVFVVASARNDIDPFEVLFELESSYGDTPPRREPGTAVAPLTANGVGIGGPDLSHAEAGHLIAAYGGGNCSGAIDVAACLTAKGQRLDFDVETFAVQIRDSNGLAVRRVMPVECERLQGFPDGYTAIEWQGKPAEDCPDAPRYKAIGNSMAVPVMAWIGERIANQIMVVAENIPAPALPIPVTKKTRSPAKKKRSPARAQIEEKYVRPFLKWAGGKYSSLDDIFAVMPAGSRLIEPFVGAGSVFLNAGFKQNLLGDVNPDLINLYNQLQNNTDAVINTAYGLVTECVTPEAYEAIRNEFNGRQADAQRHAALFLALMRCCYNGLCRYNLKGLFNVYWNKRGVKNYFPMDELRHFAEHFLQAEFVCGGFEGVIARAGEGDVIFCDPPYEPMPEKAGFTSYSGTTFKFDDQVKLVDCLVAAVERGARVVITNSSAPLILQLYIKNGMTIAPLEARRSVSCKADTRETANDIIATL